MSFLDDAREVLKEDEFAQLKSLNQKSADFDASPEEEKALFELRGKVRTFIATRDRQKNLQVIGGKAYPLKDILQVSGYSKKEILTAINELFPRSKSEETDTITKVGDFEFKGNKRYGRAPDYGTFKKAGLKKAIDGLTPFGKSWLEQEEKNKKGTIVTQPNKVNFAKMFNVTVEDLDKQLGKETKTAHKSAAKI
jgi:hypothetical protein